jgi:6-phosphogluconolactonase
MTARFVTPDMESAAEACAHHATRVLDAALARGGMVTTALSGGGTAKYLFEKLLATGFPWARVHFFWVDERSVPPADAASNYGVAEEHFLRPAGIPPHHVHRIYGELAPDSAAQRYARDISDFFGIDGSGLPRFDLLHLGMGPDAHTASLLPGDPLIEDRERIAAATYAAKFAQWRVTLLPGVLLAASHTVFLAAGVDKQEALRAVLLGDYDPLKYPAQVVARHGTDVIWFLDENAAGLLD